MGRRVMELSEADRKGLVRESYRMDGITLGECQSIFIDWALSVPVDVDTAEALRSAKELSPLNEWAMQATGSTGYSAQLGWRQGKPEITLESSLEGLALNCQHPWANRPPAARPSRCAAACKARLALCAINC